MTSLTKSDWQGIFDRATLKATQLRAGSVYILAERGNDAIPIAIAKHEAQAQAAFVQLARFDA